MDKVCITSIESIPWVKMILESPVKLFIKGRPFKSRWRIFKSLGFKYYWATHFVFWIPGDCLLVAENVREYTGYYPNLGGIVGHLPPAQRSITKKVISLDDLPGVIGPYTIRESRKGRVLVYRHRNNAKIIVNVYDRKMPDGQLWRHVDCAFGGKRPSIAEVENIWRGFIGLANAFMPLGTWGKGDMRYITLKAPLQWDPFRFDGWEEKNA